MRDADGPRGEPQSLASIRILADSDAPALERFLARHAESSMFLRSNMRRAGLTYRGGKFEGDYYGAVTAAGEVTGVVAHYWNDNILVQAPEPHVLSALCSALRAAATRPCGGVLGPSAQADALIVGLSLPRDAFTMFADETLYALELDALRTPAAPEVRMRPAAPADAELLRAWMKAYEMEAIGRHPGDELDALVAARVADMVSGENCWLLEQAGLPVSLSGFNARLPDVVQVGPVWTPPERRSHGFARVLVALTLRAARAQGVAKALLFTDNPPAVKAYEALGFRRCGSYRLALLRQPVALRS